MWLNFSPTSKNSNVFHQNPALAGNCMDKPCIVFASINFQFDTSGVEITRLKRPVYTSKAPSKAPLNKIKNRIVS